MDGGVDIKSESDDEGRGGVPEGKLTEVSLIPSQQSKNNLQGYKYLGKEIELSGSRETSLVGRG